MEVLPIYMLPFRTVFLMFLLFSFVGWVSEVFYVGVFHEHKFVNRGFLYGPICPIYGFGGLVILLLPQQLYSTWIPLFFASLVLCSIVEYFVSWLLEKLFHTLWWDYSHYKFNIRGRVCLLNSVLFGLMGMLGVHFVFPYVFLLLSLLSKLWERIVSDGCAVVLTTDLILTLKRLVDFNTAMAKLKTFGESLRDHYGHETWFRGESLMEMVQSVREHVDIKKDKASQRILERIEQLNEIKQRSVDSILAKFPTMRSTHYHDEIQLLRQKLKERFNK